MIQRTRYASVVLAALLPALALGASQSGCGKKDEETPVATVAPPVPTPAPTPTVAPIVPEEDAGSDAADAAPDVAKPATGGGASATIAKCCAALSGNAASAPPEQKGSYLAAAAACQGLRNTPAAQQAFAQIRSFLAGAKMPGACQ
jgi:type IV secretory pathway VirB10-like protein